MDFKEFIQIDREKNDKNKFSGTFLDYLELVKVNPDIAKLSHKRVYDMILKQGVEELKGDENPRIRKIYGNDVIRRYGFLRMSFMVLIK